MHSACHQVEEGTVLNSAHSFHTHPSIFSTSAYIEPCKTLAINSPPPPGRSAYSPLPHRGEDGGEGMVNSFCLLSLSLRDIPSLYIFICRFAASRPYIYLKRCGTIGVELNSVFCLLSSDLEGGVL